MNSKINILPSIGDIVWCKFPDHNGLVSKCRPAIVTAVSKTKHQIQVAYGTSQKTHILYKNEFLIAKSDGSEPFRLSGLSYDTKFDMGSKLVLPFTTMYFSDAPSKNNIPAPKMGCVHIMYMKNLSSL